MNGLTRNRFAPSPTGYAHIGGMRTALLEWLFARSSHGKFILRIEDTDRTRYVEDAVPSLMRGLRWLGIDWDEGPEVEGPFGPYYQSERLDLYKKYAQQLVDCGAAYKCYCSKERLTEVRKGQEQRHEPPMYDRHCRTLTPEQQAEYEAQGITPVIRLAVPREGQTTFHDYVRGDITFENKLMDDFILLKSDGFPTYHLANVVDDHLMEMTHVLRAEEWLSSTPKHVLIYKALGWEPPVFAHLPLVLGPDHSKLSKRHGATDVDVYRKEGYLPEAMMNFLVLLGWSPGDNQEIFTKEELLEKFSLDGLTSHPAIFDINKLQWMNGDYIRRTDLDRLTDLCIPYLVEAKLLPEEPSAEDREYLRKVLSLMQERMKLLTDVVTNGSFFFKDEIEYDDKSKKKWLTKADTDRILAAALKALTTVEDWKAEDIEAAARKTIDELGLTSAGHMIHRLRAAATGCTVGPGLFETLEILGRGRCLKRIEYALNTFAPKE